MSLVLCVIVVLFGCPLGKMLALHPSPEPSALKANRCKEELEIRKVLLESLNLQQEPRMSMLKMSRLRELWKAHFTSTNSSSPGNSMFPEDSGNSTCCKHSCQVLIKDLGWEHWVVYPESITFVQCQCCGESCCSESADAPAQCCKPTAHTILPFVYMDEGNSLVLSSVSLIRDCGCDPGEVMTLS